MENTNSIYERKNPDGTTDYVVNFGDILYNDKILRLSNLVIPLKQQSFFYLPLEKRFYAAVNIYYSVTDGSFVFDLLKKSSSYIDFYDATALTNLLPVGQFIIQQSLASFEVKKINAYSRMSTFSITTDFEKGDIGAKGPVGETGFIGETGIQGNTGG